MISVVVPALNEEKRIVTCLKSLKEQTLSTAEYEIIVVDNGSFDQTGQIAKSFGIKVVFEPRRGPAYARQAGFRAAQGGIIASTDADTIVPKDWLEIITLEFKDNSNLIGVTGLGIIEDSGWKLKLASKYGYWVLLWLKFALDRPHFSGFNFAVKKWAFEEIGGFDTSLKIAEDVDLSARLRRVGQVMFDPKLIAYPSGRRFKQGWVKTLRYYLFS